MNPNELRKRTWSATRMNDRNSEEYNCHSVEKGEAIEKDLKRLRLAHEERQLGMYLQR